MIYLISIQDYHPGLWHSDQPQPEWSGEAISIHFPREKNPFYSHTF